MVVRVEQRWVRGTCGLDERSGRVRCSRVERDCDHDETLVGQLLVQRLPHGQVESTASIRCPRHHEDLLATMFAERVFVTFEVSQREVGCDRRCKSLRSRRCWFTEVHVRATRAPPANPTVTTLQPDLDARPVERSRMPRRGTEPSGLRTQPVASSSVPAPCEPTIVIRPPYGYGCPNCTSFASQSAATSDRPSSSSVEAIEVDRFVGGAAELAGKVAGGDGGGDQHDAGADQHRQVQSVGPRRLGSVDDGRALRAADLVGDAERTGQRALSCLPCGCRKAGDRRGRGSRCSPTTGCCRARRRRGSCRPRGSCRSSPSRRRPCRGGPTT